MKVMRRGVDVPVDFEGEVLNLMIGVDGKAWVCIDGVSVLRCRGLAAVTVDDQRFAHQKKAAQKYVGVIGMEIPVTEWYGMQRQGTWEIYDKRAKKRASFDFVEAAIEYLELVNKERPVRYGDFLVSQKHATAETKRMTRRVKS